jgi:hypothetical protein
VTAEWPREADLLDRADRLGDGWTANLHPSLATLLESHRALIRTLCAPPPGAAPDCGWGFKEVRLSADHARYLHLLFPRAKFLFVVRDPLAAYASYKTWRSWYVRWPEGQVRTPWAYAALWSELAGGFLDLAPSVGGTVLRYEDLVPGGEAIARLEELLGAKVDEGVLGARISGHDAGPETLSRLERRIIARRTAAVASRLGYPAASTSARSSSSVGWAPDTA